MTNRCSIGLISAAMVLLSSYAPLAAKTKPVPPLPINMSCFVMPPYDGTLKFVNEGPGTAPANSVWQWSFGFPGPAKGYCRLEKPLAPHQWVLEWTGHITSFISTCEVKRISWSPRKIPFCRPKP